MSNTERAPEPTMDEILASIRRIIAEDDASDAAQQAGAEASEGVPDDDVFDLSADQIADPAADDEPEPLDLVNEISADQDASGAPEHATDTVSDDIDAAFSLDVDQVVEDRIDEVEIGSEAAPEDVASLMEAVAEHDAAPEGPVDAPGAPDAQDEGDYDAISSVDQLLAELKQRQSEAEASDEPLIGDAEPEFAAEAPEAPEQELYDIERAGPMEGAVDAAEAEVEAVRDEGGDAEVAHEASSDGGTRSFDDPLEAALANLAAGLEETDAATEEVSVEAEVESAGPPEIVLGAQTQDDVPADDDLASLEDLPAARVAEELEVLSEVDLLAEDGAVSLEDDAEEPAEAFAVDDVGEQHDLSAAEAPEDHRDLHAAEGADDFKDLSAEAELSEHEETYLAEGAEQFEDMAGAEATEESVDFEGGSATDDLRDLEEEPVAGGAEEAPEYTESESLAELEELAAIGDAGNVEVAGQAEPKETYEPGEPQVTDAAPIAAAAVAAAASAAGNGLAEELPAAGGSRHAPTLEDSVKELLRPMLQQWLDANMPQIVESVVREQLSAADQSDEAS